MHSLGDSIPHTLSHTLTHVPKNTVLSIDRGCDKDEQSRRATSAFIPSTILSTSQASHRAKHPAGLSPQKSTLEFVPLHTQLAYCSNFAPVHAPWA